MNFGEALWQLILGGDGRIPSNYPGSTLLVLAAGCAIMGLIAVLLDRTDRQRSEDTQDGNGNP